MNFYTLLLADAADVAQSTEDVSNLMNSTLSFGQRATLGLQMLLFGMAVVFSILLLLWAILSLFKVIFYDIPNKRKAAEAPAEIKTAGEITVPEALPITEMPAETEPDETELVAAITAALTVVMDKPQTSFRVVSFRRSASK